jgi:hypothetical protein
MAISLHSIPVKSSFMTALNHLRNGTGVESDPPEELDARAYALAQEGPLGQAYNEAAFEYFLKIEQERAQRSGRRFLLLLADLRNQSGETALVGRPVALQLFAALWLCVRETDFVGWYREDQVAGAVLTQRAELPDAEISRQVLERITRVLNERLPRDIAARLQVRIHHLPDMPNGRRQ